MKGKIAHAEHVKRYFVSWYHAPHKKTYKIYYYKGEPLFDRRMAEKLLACMQADVEKGIFRIEQYTKIPSAVVTYLKEWIEIIKPTLSPATYLDYMNSIKNHLIPFFDNHPIQLHEIQHDTLLKLLNSIDRDGKGQRNVMYCLHACLDFAWRSGRIPTIPPFPKKKAYNIIETPIEWLPEDRQRSVIRAIPLEHQPIFWWMKQHLRRPCEAMSLHKADFDGEIFTIHRSFSARQLAKRTKTGDIHYIPMVDEFIPYVEIEKEKQISHSIVSPFFFINPTGKKQGQHYTQTVLSYLWHRARKQVGESIALYKGLKHSSCSQLVNEHGYSIQEVQMATDHARLESVKKYAKVEVSARKALLEKKIIKFKEAGTNLERKRRG
ncbi:MAG: tyrosine-type recombinase/integrase [Syntrophorhabdaceae bacterium]|nr:tyrosine-type recombinase/integrase [Syntrophorhabdaceae bacterium]